MCLGCGTVGCSVQLYNCKCDPRSDTNLHIVCNLMDTEGAPQLMHILTTLVKMHA